MLWTFQVPEVASVSHVVLRCKLGAGHRDCQKNTSGDKVMLGDQFQVLVTTQAIAARSSAESEQYGSVKRVAEASGVKSVVSLRSGFHFEWCCQER